MIVPPLVFADASYYIALLSKPDADRQRAFEWQRYLSSHHTRIITTGVTDCFSFVIMGERLLTAALTFDHHFVQAGFTALLLQPPP